MNLILTYLLNLFDLAFTMYMVNRFGIEVEANPLGAVADPERQRVLRQNRSDGGCAVPSVCLHPASAEMEVDTLDSLCALLPAGYLSSVYRKHYLLEEEIL